MQSKHLATFFTVNCVIAESCCHPKFLSHSLDHLTVLTGMGRSALQDLRSSVIHQVSLALSLVSSSICCIHAWQVGRVILVSTSILACCLVYNLFECPWPCIVQWLLVLLPIVGARGQRLRVASNKSRLPDLLPFGWWPRCLWQFFNNDSKMSNAQLSFQSQVLMKLPVIKLMFTE